MLDRAGTPYTAVGQMSKQTLSDLYFAAHECENAQPQIAVDRFRDIVLGDHPNDAEAVKVKEQALQKLANLYAKQHKATALQNLLAELRPLFALIPKAKTAKIVRVVVDTIAKVPNSTSIQVQTNSLLLRCQLVAPISAVTCSWRSAKNRSNGLSQKSAPS